MMGLKRCITAWATLSIALLLAAGNAQARDKTVDAWVASDLSSFVASQLRDMPRFKGSTVRFVVFEAGRPVAETDQLSLNLRNRLQREVLESDGIRIGWQPDPATSGLALPSFVSACDADEVDLLVGLESRDLGGGEMEFSVRALDVIERSWISGFSQVWRGTLTREQRAAAGNSATDRTFLGERGVPYRHSETDLMAKHLAHDLSCQLMRQLSGDYRIASLAGDSGDEDIDRVLALVRHQVAGVNSLQIVNDERQTNATLVGKLHSIDRSLHQFWVTLSPQSGDGDLAPLKASVYLRLPDYPAEDPIVFGKPRLASESIRLQSPETGVLRDLRFVRVTSSAVCATTYRTSTGNRMSRSGECPALRVNTRPDAVVFILNHQLNRGLVRLGDERCNHRPAARVSASDQGVLVRLPGDNSSGDWMPVEEWDSKPGSETYYVIAVSDSRTARRVADLVAELPQRCSDSVRLGLTGSALDGWLSDLDRELVRGHQNMDWRAIRVRQVY